MKLGLRVAVATIVSAMLTIVALRSVDASDRHEESAMMLIASILELLSEPGEQGRCEANPSAWTPHVGPYEGLPVFRKRMLPIPHALTPRFIGADERLLSIGGGGDRPFPFPAPPRLPPPLLPIEFFVLDASLRAANPGGPKLDDRSARKLAWSEAVVLPSWWWSDTVEVIVHSPWRGGPCSYVYARGRARGVLDLELPSSRLWLPPIVGVLCAVLVAIAPMVRRVRRLTEAITSSATAGGTS